MRQREVELPEGGRLAEGEGREDEGRGTGGDRNQKNERGEILERTEGKQLGGQVRLVAEKSWVRFLL